MIGDHIEIKVLSVEGDQVKLGIVAPKTVKVHRSEVFEAIQEQNREALAVLPEFLQKLRKRQ